jgi:hypothetical protein
LSLGKKAGVQNGSCGRVVAEPNSGREFHISEIMKRKAAVERVQRRIVTVRGLKVLLDADLAQLYGVSTKALNQAVKRNLK